MAQVERWGGDVLPALLFEGSLAGDAEDGVGAMVKKRWAIVAEINEVQPFLLPPFLCMTIDVNSVELTHASGSILRTTFSVYIPTTIHSCKRRV